MARLIPHLIIIHHRSSLFLISSNQLYFLIVRYNTHQIIKMPVTQRLILPDQTGADWKEPLKFLLQTPKKQDGNIRTRRGPHRENFDNLELLIGKSTISPLF
jgi:hypothetical protein